MIFDLSHFLFDADQNALFFLKTYIRLLQFSHIETGNFLDYFMVLNERVTSFLHRERQVSRRFCLVQDTQFYRVDILHFPGTL